MNTLQQRFLLFVTICGCSCFAQNLAHPILPNPQAAGFSDITTGILNVPSSPAPFHIGIPTAEQQNQKLIQEAERNMLRQQNADRQTQTNNENIHYSLPSFAGHAGATYYYEAYNHILTSDSLHSLKNNIFTIENAYFSNALNQADFDKIIRNCRNFLISIMQERGYDLNSNTAKNYMLFQFFAESLQLKKSDQEHLPFTYDFEDYTGANDYSKMFVTKLLRTGSGQCHSLPLLYLILADEIGAEAYLALSPNHSYIRFPDDHGKWYNIELTNGMFSTSSYILQSGYIKSEALQNRIYMQPLNHQELLSQQLVDLAAGYVHKYGYDEFVQAVVEKALKLYPNSIAANMLKANLDTARFEYVMRQIGINPHDSKQLQNIRYYPKAIELLNTVNGQYAVIDNLGYEPMPEEAYQKWLQAMTAEQQKQEDKAIQEQFKGLQPETKNLRH